MNQHTTLLAIIDHSGRGGNVFVSTIFDQNDHVLSCPLIQYIYSYVLSELGESQSLPAKSAHKALTEKSYFRYIYNDLNEELAESIYRFGADPETPLDRAKVRDHFDKLVLSNDTITRKELIQAAYQAYALAIGRDLSKIRYILVTDAPSMRTEHVLHGFRGASLLAMMSDYSDAHIIHLTRDPRATFASNRHQFTNQFGNIHGVAQGTGLQTLLKNLRFDFTMYAGTVFIFWPLYFIATLETVSRIKSDSPQNFFTLRNEDLNLNFVPTMEKLCSWLDIPMQQEWHKGEDFVPTILGEIWKGIGSYNNRYQKITDGPLQNDSPDVSSRSAGPNRHVTERWKKKLSTHEIFFIEYLFEQELTIFNYPFTLLHPENSQTKKFFVFLWHLTFPFKGELPQFSKKLDLSYVLCFPLLYLWARLSLIILILMKKFSLPEAQMCPHTPRSWEPKSIID